jgi:D-alanyl-D-alanine dipeptidase
MNVRLLVLTTATAIAAVTAACGKRAVEVRTAPAQQAPVSIQVDNTTNQAVNVYVVANGVETFLRQVSAMSKTSVPVPGIAAGTTVGLKAVTADGARTYSRASVVLSGTFAFTLP